MGVGRSLSERPALKLSRGRGTKPHPAAHRPHPRPPSPVTPAPAWIGPQHCFAADVETDKMTVTDRALYLGHTANRPGRSGSRQTFTTDQHRDTILSAKVTSSAAQVTLPAWACKAPSHRQCWRPQDLRTPSQLEWPARRPAQGRPPGLSLDTRVASPRPQAGDPRDTPAAHLAMAEEQQSS